MDTSGKLLFSRLISLVKNGQWEKDDVIKLLIALMKHFKGRIDDFPKWIMRILYQVEIHRIRVSDLTSNDGEVVDNVEVKINEIPKNTDEKTLQEILKEIHQQGNIDEEIMKEVKDVVSSVYKSLSYPTAPHLQGIKQILFQLCKAVEKTKKYRPRLTQMVSWCILVLSKSSRLVQVGTGEGKSCIVAMFAAYQALEGKNPDIITSSPVLAERDAKEWSGFYKKMNIRADFNTNKLENELKECYACQVVYGTTVSFAGDWLKQRVHRQDLRPHRKFQCVIVDEVDSLMLDKGLEVVYISSEIPLMESLNGILAEIWFAVNQLKRLDTGEILGPIQPFCQVISEIMNENRNIDEVSIVQMAEDAGMIKSSMQIRNRNILKQFDNASAMQAVAFLTMFVRKFPQYIFKMYQQAPGGKLQKLTDINSTDPIKRKEISILLVADGRCHLVYNEEGSLVKSLGDMVCQSASTSEKNESGMPGFQDLIKAKVQTWIKNALKATKMTLGHEYILHADGVVPVDYSSTGVVQNDMRWEGGLQQFLEMKHQTKLSNMSLIANFMSNFGLFKKYKKQIYGITGTLGEQTELDMLKKLYTGIETCKIPSFRPRKLYELEGLVIPEEDKWITTVCNVVQEQVSSTVYRGPRAVLLICETINRAKNFHKKLADTVPRGKLKLYVNNNMDNSKIVNNELQAGDVIVATNLAGRGTDLKVCKGVNEAGGLFVLQTFLPLNFRVEQQAFGRTARQGSPGSAQLIVCTSHFSDTVKLVMDIKSSTTTLFSHLCCLIKQMSHCVIENIFEEAVNCYLKNHDSQTHEAVVSAATGVLHINSYHFRESNLEKAKVARNTEVTIRLSEFENDIKQIIKKEELFSVYLDVLDDIYYSFLCFIPSQCNLLVSSLHECWSLWLLMHSTDGKSTDILKIQLRLDLLEAKYMILSRESPSSMVYYYIRSGNILRKKGCLAKSIEMYTKALEDGVCWEIIPRYNRALTTIMKKDTGYITQALADLEKADKAIDSYKSQLGQIQKHVETASQKTKAEGRTLLSTQFQAKCMVIDQLRMSIQDAVMKLRRAESRRGDVKLTEKLTFFLPENFILGSPSVLKELPMELMHIRSLGLDTIFTLDTIFSFSGFLTKLLK